LEQTWCGFRGVTFDQDLGSLTGSHHANLAAASLRERALRHTQETPIAAAAARSVEPRIRRHGAGGATRKSWRDSATDITERLGLDIPFGKASLWVSRHGVVSGESLLTKTLVHLPGLPMSWTP